MEENMNRAITYNILFVQLKEQSDTHCTGLRCKCQRSSPQPSSKLSSFCHVSEQSEDVGRRRQFGSGLWSFFNNGRKSVLIRQCALVNISLSEKVWIQSENLVGHIWCLVTRRIHHTGERVIHHTCHRFPVELNYPTHVLRNCNLQRVLLIKPPPKICFIY